MLLSLEIVVSKQNFLASRKTRLSIQRVGYLLLENVGKFPLGGLKKKNNNGNLRKCLKDFIGKYCHFNGHILGFHPQIQKLEPPCKA